MHRDGSNWFPGWKEDLTPQEPQRHSRCVCHTTAQVSDPPAAPACSARLNQNPCLSPATWHDCPGPSDSHKSPSSLETRPRTHTPLLRPPWGSGAFSPPTGRSTPTSHRPRSPADVGFRNQTDRQTDGKTNFSRARSNRTFRRGSN